MIGFMSTLKLYSVYLLGFYQNVTDIEQIGLQPHRSDTKKLISLHRLDDQVNKIDSDVQRLFVKTNLGLLFEFEPF